MYEVIKDTLDNILEDLECSHDLLNGCREDIENMPKKELSEEAEETLSDCYSAATFALELSDKVRQLSYDVVMALSKKEFESNKLKNGD